MTLVIIFASSLLLGIILFVLKAIEIKYNKYNIIFKNLSRLDPKSEKLLSVTKNFIFSLIQTARYLFGVKLRQEYTNLIAKVKEKIIFEYQKRHDMMMGKRDISVNGSASFYLRKIAENKNVEGGGKIEDMLPE